MAGLHLLDFLNSHACMSEHSSEIDSAMVTDSVFLMSGNMRRSAMLSAATKWMSGEGGLRLRVR